VSWFRLTFSGSGQSDEEAGSLLMPYSNVVAIFVWRMGQRRISFVKAVLWESLDPDFGSRKFGSILARTS
jgi:hypothetical protein